MKDIDRPLGQEPRRRGPRRPRLPGAGTVLVSVLAVVLFGSSAAIALRDRPFRDPVEKTPLTVERTQQDAAKPAPPAKPEQTAAAAPAKRDGPSIIHVGPQRETGGEGVLVIRDPSAAAQDIRIAHLPDRDLIEDSPTGPLPVRGPDGKRPFDVYARPWSGARGARVAIVIGGLGLSQTGTQNAIEKLPAEVTLAFASQGNSLDRWMQDARRAGHEIVMQVPLEPYDYPNVNPGRNTLTVDASAAENTDRLDWALSRTTNYTSVMNYMGARFVTDEEAMKPVMAELGQRGLGYVDDGSSARSVAENLARANGVPFMAADEPIDESRDRGEILKKLDELERIARAKGFALGTGFAFDETVDAVASWIREAKKRGIEIVPVSALASDPERS